MRLKGIAAKFGFAALSRALEPGDEKFIKIGTAIAANQWAVDKLGAKPEGLPFPFAHDGNMATGTEWKITRWERAWLQREFYLLHKSSNTLSRWINGKTQPMQKL